MAKAKLQISAAQWAGADQSLVRLTFNDGTAFATYPEDGSPDIYADVLLREWLDAGNTIAPAAEAP
jgi:hypothetical protein